jgi:hypothetical protein
MPELTYLIDSQCSQRLRLVHKEKPSFQPIKLRIETLMLNSERDIIELSKAQAIWLSKALEEAAKRYDDPPDNWQYPGCPI